MLYSQLMMIYSLLKKTSINSHLFLIKWVFLLLVWINFLWMMIINFDKYDPDTIIDARPLAWCNKFEKPKSVKEDISKELISVV